MAILKYSVRFNLQHNISKNKDTAIRCTIRFNNQRTVFGTNLKINPKFWNVKTQEPKTTSSYDGTEILGKINSIKEFVRTEFDKLESYPDPDYIKSLCLAFIGDASKQKVESEQGTKYFIGYFADLVNKMRSGAKRISRGKTAGQKYTRGTVQSYESILGVFQGMAKHYSRKDYLFEEIDKKFYDDLQHYFYNERKQSAGYFATTVKILKSVMSEAKEDGLHSFTAHEGRYFVKPSYESDTIYLSVQHLEKISNVELERDHLKKARDIFLVGCWTGLRFSDFSELKIDDIDGNYIRVLTEKTKERVTIPCHPIIKEVLGRNGGHFPGKISSQQLNEYIKEVGEKAGLTKVVSFRKSVGGVDVYEKIAFHKLISTHTARRSFATNMFKMGIPTFVIMAITGHRTEASFFKYIRVSNEEKAQMMRDMWEKLGIFK